MIKYELAAESDVVVYDSNDIKVTLKDYELNKDTLTINTTVENNSDKVITLSMDSTYINGWDKYVSFHQELEPGKKAKNVCAIYKMSEVDVASAEDLDTLEFKFILRDKEANERIDVTDTLTIVFNSTP